MMVERRFEAKEGKNPSEFTAGDLLFFFTQHGPREPPRVELMHPGDQNAGLFPDKTRGEKEAISWYFSGTSKHQDETIQYQAQVSSGSHREPEDKDAGEDARIRIILNLKRANHEATYTLIPQGQPNELKAFPTSQLPYLERVGLGKFLKTFILKNPHLTDIPTSDTVNERSSARKKEIWQASVDRESFRVKQWLAQKIPMLER